MDLMIEENVKLGVGGLNVVKHIIIHVIEYQCIQFLGQVMIGHIQLQSKPKNNYDYTCTLIFTITVRQNTKNYNF